MKHSFAKNEKFLKFVLNVNNKTTRIFWPSNIEF